MKRPHPPCLVRAGAFATRLAAASFIACLAPPPARAQNTANYFTGPSGGSLLTLGYWSLTLLPTASHDAVFTATTGIRALTAADLTAGSFNVTASVGTFSIQNKTTIGTDSTLTLGGPGNSGNSVSGTAADLLYAATGSTFLIRGDNGGTTGTGVLHLILGQSGNFNIAGTSTISSVIADGGSHHGFTKTGGGTLTLSAINTYDGNTTVSSGTLILADNAGLKFTVSDRSNNRLAGTATATLKGDLTIDTSAVTATVGSWTLVDVATLNETFDPAFSVTGFSPQPDSITWIRTEGSKTWTFSESSGALTLTNSLSAYDAWATTTFGLTGANAVFDFDFDHDGLANGLEWILGGDPTRPDPVPISPTVTGNAASGLTLVFMRSSATVAETTLAVEWGGAPASLANRMVIGSADSGPNGNQPVVDLDAPAAGQVTVTIPAANASGGKLFARLAATRR